MKKLYRIFAMAALVMAASSCVQEQFEPVTEEIGYGEGTVISASLPATSDTKVSYEMDAENKVLKTRWEEGDVIYYTTGSGNGTAFTQVGAISEDGKFTQFEASLNLSANKKMLFTYPVSYKTSSNGNLRIYAHDGTLEQVMADNDYLYGFVTTDANKVLPNIEFKRVSAFLEIKDLTFPSDVNATISKIYLMGPNMGNRIYLNTSTEEITVYRDATMVISPEDYNIAGGKVEGDKVLYAAFIPTAEAAQGDECTLMFQTEDGTMYEKKWKAGSKYTPGKMYQVTGEVTKPITFNIQFEDPAVKNILVGGNNWYGLDHNGDGELSNVEASLVTTLNWMFYQQTSIEKFNEFVYFTGVSTFIGSNSTGGGGFYGCTNLKEITLPPSVTVIGSDAFNGCTSLETFTVPETVEKINAGAFKNCTSLREITIPSTVTYMGEGSTFAGCTSLKTLTWPTSTTVIGASTFMDSALETFVIPETVTEIGNQAFMNCKGITAITIPSSVTKIGTSAFANCTGITEIVVPEGVTTLGNQAFFNTALKTVSLPSTITSIGSKAFNQNPYITKFTIAEGTPYSVSDDVSILVKTSGDVVEAVGFFGNKTEIAFPANVNKIGASFADGSPDLVKVTIPAVTNFGSNTFANCPKLTTAVYAAEATTTGNNTFQNCTALTDVTLPTAITQLGSNLFNGCTALKTVTIPDGVNKINSGVFRNSGIEEITLPASLTEIVADLFNGCKSLKNIAIPASVKKINNNAFKDCVSLAKIEIPASVTTIGNAVFSGCTGLTDLKLPEGLTIVSNSLLMNCTGIKSITLPESVTTIQANAFKGSGLTGFTVPSKVTKIESSVFAECPDLKTVTIPETVTAIGMWAFQKSGLESITIPSSVTKLEMYTFEECTKLKTVNLPETLTSIAQNLFAGCTSLETITFPESLTKLANSIFDGCTSLKTVNLPQSLTALGTFTFQNCTALKSFTVPSKVTSLGGLTFSGCTSLVEVILQNPEPCSVSTSTFPLDTNEELVFYVPDASLDAYKAHSSWSNEAFAGRIFAVSARE
ncbi:MAG: leucine-rich repeat domain-containing protein [Bacteroidales bacterium]|nr:leucine-rich repeat domain-containing protein [Bacteroidales bacterium]